MCIGAGGGGGGQLLVGVCPKSRTSQTCSHNDIPRRQLLHRLKGFPPSSNRDPGLAILYCICMRLAPSLPCLVSICLNDMYTAWHTLRYTYVVYVLHISYIFYVGYSRYTEFHGITRLRSCCYRAGCAERSARRRGCRFLRA